MVNFVVLNEISLPLSKDEHKLNEVLKNFSQISKELKENSINIIRSAKNLNEIELINGEYLSEFLGKIEDKDLKRLAISIFSNKIIEMKSPLYTKEEAEQNDVELIEYKYKSKNVLGFGAGDIFDTIVISFLTDDDWNNSKIEVKKESIGDDGEVVSENLGIKHSSTLENLLVHKEFFNILTNDRYNVSKEEFWSRREDLFQKIKFCDEVRSQIKKVSKSVYEAFINKLKLVELGDKTIEDWNYSPDSTVTMERYREERTFFHSDFDKGIAFENHIKSFPDSNRMYFFKKDEFIYIGYIGKHLRTVKHK
ncbi:MAG: hypothetical protein ACRCZ9_05055 [Fusobacteriaceae bacterium]